MTARGRMSPPLQLVLLALISVTSSQAFAVGDGVRCSACTGATKVPPSLASSCNNAPHSYRHLPTLAPGHHRRQSSPSSTALASTSCWSTERRVDEDEGIITTFGKDVSSPSPRLWMEDIEQSEGCGGAYTVMRCEIVKNVGSTGLNEDRYKWKTWDFDFHLKRLQTSYEIKYAQEEGGSSRDACSEDGYLKAELESELAVAKMLDEAKCEMEFKTLRAILDDADTIPVLMVTILWTKKTKDGSQNNGEEQNPLRVRAHGSIASVPLPESGKLPAAIQASIALPPVVGGSSLHQRDWSSLPNRHEHGPDAKDSSWCRERRPLEEMFKADGIGEVLLARAVDADGAGEFHGIELLEGLTSNLFVVYRDGTLRTAAAEGSVLPGSARHFVLEAAEKLGLSYDETKPVLLQDAVDGIWSEVFVTSAIRLVVPVTSLSIPEYDEKDEGNDEAKNLSFRTIWDATDSGIDAASTDEQGELDTVDWALTVEKLKGEQGWTGKLYREVISSNKGINLSSALESLFDEKN